MRPKTLIEWQAYIAGLDANSLYSQTVAANTHSFARTLLEEGTSMSEVEQIMLMFVRELRAKEIKIPEGGPFDLVTMSYTDDQAGIGVEASPPVEPVDVGMDDYDRFELEAAMD